MVNGVVKLGSVPHYLNCLTLSTGGVGDHGDIVAHVLGTPCRVKGGLQELRTVLEVTGVTARLLTNF